MWVLTRKYVGIDDYVDDIFVAVFSQKPTIEDLVKTANFLGDFGAECLLREGDYDCSGGELYLKEMAHAQRSYNGKQSIKR